MTLSYVVIPLLNGKFDSFCPVGCTWRKELTYSPVHAGLSIWGNRACVPICSADGAANVN